MLLHVLGVVSRQRSLGESARIVLYLLELSVVRLFPIENFLHSFPEDQVFPRNLILFGHVIIDGSVSLVFIPLVHRLVDVLKARATFLIEHGHDLLVLGLDFH